MHKHIGKFQCWRQFWNGASGVEGGVGTPTRSLYGIKHGRPFPSPARVAVCAFEWLASATDFPNSHYTVRWPSNTDVRPIPVSLRLMPCSCVTLVSSNARPACYVCCRAALTSLGAPEPEHRGEVVTFAGQHGPVSVHRPAAGKKLDVCVLHRTQRSSKVGGQGRWKHGLLESSRS